ncbi:hypothetical protein [Metamycoplasma hominis]|uniref:hypothetical protein n=1 Tax=Metamycoplasma hominis TaxID=2098 RepID=UPI0034A3F611
MNNFENKNIENSSKWTGSVLGFFFMKLLVFFLVMLSMATLFLTLPWIVVFFRKYMTRHTYVNGKQLQFNGTGAQLFGSFIKWWALSFVTLGVYGAFFMPVRMIQWFAKHTVFAE